MIGTAAPLPSSPRSARGSRARWLLGLLLFACLGPWVLGPGIAGGQDAGDEDVLHAFVGARVIPVEGAEIEEGVLLVRGSKIVAVGAKGEVEIPQGARLHDLAGKTVMPGLVCTHSHIGGIGGADGSGPIQPEARVHESINVKSSGFRRAVAGGLTTLNIMPGSGHLMSGQTIYVKLR